jgi:iron complex transport system substrate-binding protein
MLFKHLKFLLVITAITLFFYACKNKEKKQFETTTIQNENSIKYAKGFEIQHFKTYKKLIIKSPYQNSTETFEYLLSNDFIKSDLKNIKTPINTIVVTSTTHIPMLELLNVENKLVGFPNTDYISSKKTRKLIDNGKVIDLGNEENINTEVLLDLEPNLVVGFSINSNNKMFATIEKMGIPVILNGAWLEETPLGSAEWIKMFGVLLNKEKEADSIFKSIEKKYIDAKNIALKAIKKPTIISGGLFKDIWNLPAGDSFEATFLKDANTNYLWKETTGKGSLSLNIENVFEKGKDADIWVSPSFHTSLDDLKNTNEIYANFKAFKNGEIYSFSNKKGEKGGIIYFELATARPDLVLKDLIKIAHPELMTNYELTFFEKLK